MILMLIAGRNTSASPTQPPRQRVTPSAHKTYNHREHNESGGHAHDSRPSVRYVL